MNRTAILFLMGFAPWIAMAGGAQVCKEAGGGVTYSDVRPKNCTSSSLRQQQEEQDRREAEEAAVQKRQRDAAHDRKMLRQYPDEATLISATEPDLAELRRSLSDARERQRQFLDERRRLDDQLEFYRPPHRVPADLGSRVDAADARLAAQRSIISSIEARIQTAEQARSRLLAQMRVLWNPVMPTREASAR